MMRMTTLLLAAAAFLCPSLPVAAQATSGGCPRIPSVSSDPLNRTYKAGDQVPAELLDPPFIWAECPAPNLPAGMPRSGQARVVFLSVTVDETGAVIDARPRGAIDPEGFYDAAVAVIRRWRTNRPLWRGISVKASIAVDVRFTRSDSAAEQPSPAPPAAAVPEPAASQPAPTTPPPPAKTETTPPATEPTPTPPAPAAAETPAPAPARTEPAVTPPAKTPATTQPPEQPAPIVPTPTPTQPPAQLPAAIEQPPARTEMRTAPPARVPAQDRGADPFVVEYYYKVRWGFAEEFWLLFNRNHWPLLQRQMQMGRILEVTAARPRYHATEDGRWDYRVTIVFRSAAEANAPFDTEALERQLFSDLAGYRREEKRRFELLLGHWDVPILPATLEP